MRVNLPTVAAMAALALAGCGGRDAATSPPSSPEGAQLAEQAQAAPAGPPATRQDVIDALTCHALLSQAMANDILGGDGRAVAGIREQARWRGEADRRAKAAGVKDEEFAELQSQARAPIVTKADWEAKQPQIADCVARTPAS